jgi:hypothetical protein
MKKGLKMCPFGSFCWNMDENWSFYGLTLKQITKGWKGCLLTWFTTDYVSFKGEFMATISHTIAERERDKAWVLVCSYEKIQMRFLLGCEKEK